MNTTTKYFCGDEFIISEFGYPDQIYILAQISLIGWTLISLRNGNRWSDNYMIPIAEEGMPYVTHAQMLQYIDDANISISVHCTFEEKLKAE